MNYPTRKVWCFTASPNSKIESKTISLIIIEEAQDMSSDKIQKAILPMGTDTNATVVYIGVAGYQKCLFYDLLEKLDDEHKLIIPYDEVIKQRRQYYDLTKDETYLNYEKFVEEVKRQYGEESDHFKTQYKLEWILERGQFITIADLMKLEEDYDPPQFLGKAHPVYGGIDWGKKNDSTVFTIIDEDCKVLAWFEFLGDDYNSQIESIVQIILTRFPGIKEINCDSTGTQDMAIDVLRARLQRERHNVRVNPISLNSFNDIMYKNLHRLMFDKVMDGKVIEKSVLRIPKKHSREKERFIYQASNLQKEIKNNKWVCSAPEGPAYHDDYLDSIALACLSFKPRKRGVFAIA